MATVAVTLLPSGALGLLGWPTLGERCRLTLARSAALLEQLLELGDAGVSLPERFGQALDLGFEPSDERTKIAYRVSTTARRRGGRRNSPRYARGANGWWIPLNKYFPKLRAPPDQLGDPAKQVRPS
jgi:hypothetical protein